MIANTDFGLIKNLCDNIAVIGYDHKIIFAGNNLKKILGQYNVDLSQVTSPDSNDLSKQIHELLILTANNKDYSTIKLPDSKDELILFTSGLESDKLHFLGIKERILRISRIEYELKERVKELQCLYDVSNELEKSTEINTVLGNCANLIEQSFQFSEETIVNIELNKKKFGKELSSPLENYDLLTTEILFGNEKKGEINVYLKKNLGFLDEEQKLIDEISVKISTLIEKEERTKSLEKQQKILTAKNDALLKLTQECFQKREKLSTFFKAITDIIIVIDSEFNIIMSNKDEIGEGEKCYKKIFNLDEQCNNCAGLKTFQSSNNTFLERQENSRYFTLRAYPILGIDGNVERVLEVCRDITSQKYLEAQLIQSYKLASLGKLVAGVAHEINNPNTFILGNLKIVQEAFDDIFPILDEQFKKQNDLKIARLNYEIFKENISILISDMINGANRTKKIVGDLRNFAKKDDGSMIENVDLNDIIKNKLTLTSKQIKKYASLEIELYENLPVFKGSINRIEQVLLNLTMNASEAIENGEGLIKIKTDYDKESNEILLTISDNGIGMDEATLKNIFDPFFTTKRDKGGTGLGLSISYGIIKDHGGRIEVNSSIGNGTNFTIRIPVDRKKDGKNFIN